MSIKRISAALENKTTTGNDRVCLIVLADKANDDGYCWPGITHIQEQMNVTRQTTMNTIKRLEDAGEIISERKQRKGSKYLVLPGLTDEQIIASLIKYFKATQDEAKAMLDEAQANRNKSTDHTSKKIANLVRLNSKNKSTNHTKKVYNVDQNSLTARLDPSLPVIEPSDSPNGDAVTKEPRKRSAAQLRLDGMVNALVDAFGLNPDKITRTKWSELRSAGKELLDAQATTDDVKPLYAWCKAQNWPSFTSMALAKSWPTFDRQRARNTTPNAAPTADQLAMRATLAMQQGATNG